MFYFELDLFMQNGLKDYDGIIKANMGYFGGYWCLWGRVRYFIYLFTIINFLRVENTRNK